MGRTSSKPEGARPLTVIMVELKIAMPNTPQITFFGSKKAIFEYFGNKTIGLSYTSAMNYNFANVYENAICRIYQAKLLTLRSPVLVARREAEGRQPIPLRTNSIAYKKPE